MTAFSKFRSIVNCGPGEGLSCRQCMFLGSMHLLAFGLCWSNFLVSVSTIMLAATAVFSIVNTFPYIHLKPNLRNEIKEIIDHPELLGLWFIFFSVFISGLWSDNLEKWIWFSRMKLPFLFMPLVWLSFKKITFRQLYAILCTGAISLVIFGSISLYEYFSNFSFYQSELARGKAIKTPISHIRFSLMLVGFALFFFDVYRTNKIQQKGFRKVWNLLLFLVLSIIIHILAVKSAVGAFYISFIVYFSLLFISRKKYLHVASILILGTALLYSSIRFIPAIQQKWSYMLWQYQVWKSGANWALYSDLERWVSMKVGWEMIKHQPITGSGIGDLYDVTAQTYLECFGIDKVLLPHNQFIFSWAFCGILAITSLVYVLVVYLQKSISNHSPLAVSILAMLWATCMVESTLETQMGVAYFLFFSWIVYILIRQNMSEDAINTK